MTFVEFFRNFFEISRRFPETSTPGSMNSLFGDFFREFWRGILGGVRDYLGGDVDRFLDEE